MPETKCVIHWFRRDLRISDNAALWHASRHGLPVVPLYVLSDWKKTHAWTGPNRQHFLCGCLSALAGNLKTLNGRLIVRQGDAVEELRQLADETGAVAIHFNNDPDPFGRQVEDRLRRWCGERGIACHGHSDATLHGPSEVLTRSAGPYRVYTPYLRAWLDLEKPAPFPKPRVLDTPASIRSLDLPDVSTWGLEPPGADLPASGERAARERLRRAVREKIGDYAVKRDLPAESGTSRLSQDLRFGLVSIRTAYASVIEARTDAGAAARAGIDTFIWELAWREFYFSILHHHPNVLHEEFDPVWRGLPWDEPGERFEAWKEGRTGFPIVDAGMRQLKATGFMHNRLRMIVAMFLTKDLHLDWKLGESWFMQHLVDGEIASNNGGWQWSAGTGADAAPYFRIQNPWTQTARYDPHGFYIRRWVPELAAADPSLLSKPPREGSSVAPGYPVPIVDHRIERERTLAIFRRRRDHSLR